MRMNTELAVGELVMAARQGDESAWNGLVDKYLPLVVSVTRRYRLASEDAADVNQTVWLRLVEHLDEIREPRALPGWILTTTKNEALRLLKTRGRSVAVDPLGGGLEAGESAELDEDLLLQERQLALREGLAELKPRHRELMLLLMTEPPLSYDDISERLGMPKGSIGPTRARCLSELRRTRALRSFVATRDAALGRG
jgi:RNA polymerase sigma factor (sigma-70 family)